MISLYSGTNQFIVLAKVPIAILTLSAQPLIYKSRRKAPVLFSPGRKVFLESL